MPSQIPKYITCCVKILIKLGHALTREAGGFLGHAYAGFARGGGGVTTYVEMGQVARAWCEGSGTCLPPQIFVLLNDAIWCVLEYIFDKILHFQNSKIYQCLY